MPELDPHPEQDERPGERSGERGPVIAAFVIGAILAAVVVLHLLGVLGPGSLHGS